MWFTARCSQNENYYVLNQQNAAHTSAIYVKVDGREYIDPAAVNYWIQLLKAHRENTFKNAVFENELQRREHSDYINRAIEKYKTKIEIS
jgi:hypothetical protein